MWCLFFLPSFWFFVWSKLMNNVSGFDFTIEQILFIWNVHWNVYKTHSVPLHSVRFHWYCSFGVYCCRPSQYKTPQNHMLSIYFPNSFIVEINFGFYCPTKFQTVISIKCFVGRVKRTITSAFDTKMNIWLWMSPFNAKPYEGSECKSANARNHCRWNIACELWHTDALNHCLLSTGREHIAMCIEQCISFRL